MPEQAAGDLDTVGHVLLRLARLLLAAGADSEHIQERVETLAERLGFTGQLFIGSERLLLMVGSEGVFRTRIGHAVGAMGIDAGRLFALEDVVRAIASGDLDVVGADARLQEIESRLPLYPAWLVVAAIALTAASLTRLFGASWPIVAAGFAAGVVSAVLRRWLHAFGLLPAGVTALTAGISGAVAAFPLHLAHLDPTLALVAAGMILVPGVPLINGVRDLVQGHSAIGVARLANGIVVVLGIVSGLAAASLLWGGQFPVSLQTVSLPVHWDFLFAALAALGFAIFFNAPPRAIAAIMLCGAFSHGVRTAIMVCGGSIGWATLAGSFVAATIATLLGRRLSAPWTAFAFPGVVAMVPGSYAFRAMIGALDIMTAGARATPSLLGATIGAFVSACELTAAIGIGLLIAGIFRKRASSPKVGD